jgi:hypothetical protein
MAVPRRGQGTNAGLPRSRGREGAFLVRVVVTRLSSVVAYLTFVGGLGAVCVNLAGHAGEQAMALAAPHLVAVSKDERPLTLVERRERYVVATAAVETEEPPFIPEAPGIPLAVLAAQMDVSEGMEVKAKSVARRASRSARGARPARIAAADVFGKSFGVMLMASR